MTLGHPRITVSSLGGVADRLHTDGTIERREWDSNPRGRGNLDGPSLLASKASAISRSATPPQSKGGGSPIWLLPLVIPQQLSLTIWSPVNGETQQRAGQNTATKGQGGCGDTHSGYAGPLPSRPAEGGPAGTSFTFSSIVLKMGRSSL